MANKPQTPSPNMPASRILWLVRHAQPLLAPGLCYGATDVPADPYATQQAALALAPELPAHTTVISSTLQRCELLVHSLQGLRPDLAYKTDARLTEMNFGHWEQHRWDAIPRTAYDAWTADFSHHRFGGQESVAEFMQRVASAWRELALSPGPVLWVTHAGVIRAATLLSQGVQEVTQASQWPAAAPVFGGWCTLPLDPSPGQPIVEPLR